MEKATISDFTWFNIDNYDFIKKLLLRSLYTNLNGVIRYFTVTTRIKRLMSLVSRTL